MADEKTEVATTGGGDLSSEEKAYFDSRGATAVKDGPAPPEPAEPAKADAEASGEGGDGGPTPPATAAAGADDDEGGDRGPVAYQQFKRERERRQKLEKSLEEMQRARAVDLDRMSQRLAAIQQNGMPPQQQPQRQEQPAEPEMPDPDVDFFGAQKWLMDREKARMAASENEQRQRQQTQQQQAFTQRVMGEWEKIGTTAAQDDPEFPQAYEYVTQQRFKELVASGFSEQQAAAQARQDEFQLVLSALQSRQNPAQRLKAVAQARGWNYKPPVADEPAVEPKRLDTIARGQDANKSLGTAGTGGTAKAQGARALLEMPDDEFAALFSTKKGANAFKAAAGG